MATYYHGGETLHLHSGLCLTDDRDVAREYAEAHGGDVTPVRVVLAGLEIREMRVTREMVDANQYPGDRTAERAALVADGIDAIEYTDMTPAGRTHRTLRLISDRALAAVAA